jgi:hypothetical protein
VREPDGPSAAGKNFMNIPWRGGLLFVLLFTQDPAPVRPDLVSDYASILDQGPDSRRDLAARALLSLGRPGYDALKRVLARKPELAKSVMRPGDLPPPIALVRIPWTASDVGKLREMVEAGVGIDTEAWKIREFGAPAEPFLWEALDSRNPHVVTQAGRLLRELYTPPDPAPAGRASDAIRAALDRTRDFDLSDRSLVSFLGGEAFSWILMSPRDERITLRMTGVTLRDFFRIATPKLAAVPVDDLLILIPADRIAMAEPGPAVWAPGDLAGRIELALDALGRGDVAPIDGITGVGAYQALKRAGGAIEFSKRADAMRKLLAQRVYFIEGPADEGPPITISPAGSTAQATVEAFEKAAGFGLENLDKSRLELAPPAFRFRGIPVRLAARALQFRINYLP